MLQQRYRLELVPLIVPITLLRHYVRKQETGVRGEATLHEGRQQ